MTIAQFDPDPYADLDYRADAFELAEEKKPTRIRNLPKRRHPMTSVRHWQPDRGQR